MSTALADLAKAFQVQLLVRHHAADKPTPAGGTAVAISRQLLSSRRACPGLPKMASVLAERTVQIWLLSRPAPYVRAGKKVASRPPPSGPRAAAETAEVTPAELAEGVASKVRTR